MENNLIQKPNFDLNRAADLANKYNDTKDGGSSIPVLKINYNQNSTYPLGSWVLGQKADDNDTILEQGIKVSSIIILLDRNKFSFFSNDNPGNNCSSPIHKNFEAVTGNKHHYQCGKSCKFRNPDAKESCSAQKVIFAVAIGDDKKPHECVIYLKGKSFFPIVDYLKESSKYKDENGKVTALPYFYYYTLLASEKIQEKGKNPYWVAKFTKGNYLSQAAVDSLEEKAKKLETEVIATINKLTEASSVNSNEKDPVQVPTKLNEAVEKMQNGTFNDVIDKFSESDVVEIDESQLFM